MDFEAELVNGELKVKPIIEKIKNKDGGTDIKIHVPSFPLINKTLIQNGKRNIQ